MAHSIKSVRKAHCPPSHPIRSHNHSVSGRITEAIVLSLFSGIALCVLCLGLFSMLLTTTSLPLNLVRPFACTAAAAGAMLSGFLLAKKVGKQYLLCGLGCGVFYAICQTIAAFVCTGTIFRQGSDLMLPLALILGSLFGSMVTALRAVR